jgi:hypothetical protein
LLPLVINKKTTSFRGSSLFAVARPPGARVCGGVFMFPAQTGCPKLRTSTATIMPHKSLNRKRYDIFIP